MPARTANDRARGLLAVVGIAGLTAASGCGRILYQSTAEGGDSPDGSPLDGGALVDGGGADASMDSASIDATAIDGSAIDASAPGSDGGPVPCTDWGTFGTPTRVAGVNSTLDELSPAITGDGLLLYFTRRALSGTPNIFVASRSDPSLPFGPPTEVTELGDAEDPGISRDGLEIFVNASFVLYHARRASRADDFGPLETIEVGGQSGGYLLADDRTLFATGGMDFIEYVVRADRSAPFVAVRSVTELSGTVVTGWPTVSSDGLEIFFVAGSASAPFIDRAVRASTAPSALFMDRTSVAELNIGTINGDPDLSADGSTIYFASNGPGSAGLDIWVATRGCR